MIIAKEKLNLECLSKIMGGLVYDFIGPLGEEGCLLYSKGFEDAIYIPPTVFYYYKSIAIAVNDPGTDDREIEDYIVKSILDLENRKKFGYIDVYKDINDFFRFCKPKLIYSYRGLKEC